MGQNLQWTEPWKLNTLNRLNTKKDRMIVSMHHLTNQPYQNSVIFRVWSFGVQSYWVFSPFRCSISRCLVVLVFCVQSFLRFSPSVSSHLVFSPIGCSVKLVVSLSVFGCSSVLSSVLFKVQFFSVQSFGVQSVSVWLFFCSLFSPFLRFSPSVSSHTWFSPTYLRFSQPLCSV